MAAARTGGEAGGRGTAAGPRAAPVAVGIAGAAFAVTVVGGYRLDWAWTGFSDNTTVWDWLQLLVLPCVLAVLPFWYRTRGERRLWRAIVGAVALGGSLFVAASYTFDWTWTGFEHQEFWDWLNLLVLPVVLVCLPFILSQRHTMHRGWKLAAGAALAAFVVTVVGGYGLGWHWTGFQGNTLWDWLHLLLVPFVLPAALTWASVRLSEAQAEAEAAAAVAVHE